MLRSAATPSRTEVQLSSEMPQPTIRRILRRRPAPTRSAAHVPPFTLSTKLTIAIRFFED